MLQFWQRKRSSKKHEAKVQDIRRQVRKSGIRGRRIGGLRLSLCFDYLCLLALSRPLGT